MNKKTECVKVWLAPHLAQALQRLATADERRLSDYIGIVLSRHAFGHVAKLTAVDPEEQIAE
jgi:hypothetical protein